MRNVIVVGVVILSFVIAGEASAQMKDGLWEITTKIEMKGMPNQIPAMTVKQCMTKNDITPKPMGKDQNCKIKDQKIMGDTVTYAMECKGKDGTVTESVGKMTYKGDSFEGSNNITTKSKRETMQMTSRMTGKYLGSCTK